MITPRKMARVDTVSVPGLGYRRLMFRWFRALGIVSAVSPILVLIAVMAIGCQGIRRALVSALDPEYKLPEVTGSAPTSTEINQKAPRVEFVEIAEGFAKITDLQFVSGHASRLIVVEKEGTARLLDLTPGQVAKPGPDVLSIAVNHESEMGLLGFAFHPDWDENGRIFVNYNPAGMNKTRISEWELSRENLGTKLATERRVILEVEQPYQNHNGGQLVFGPDGFLYIGMGDGGWMGDPDDNGQNPSTLLGSMLRVDVDRPGTEGRAYAIPADNPFVEDSSLRPEIWAYGLRNPWRYSFDPLGRLVVADVGQSRFEEVHIVEKGDNLGWRIVEARSCYEPRKNCDRRGLVDPVFVYPRSFGQSITGGFVYTGSTIPALSGLYIVADFVRGHVWAVPLPEDRTQEADDDTILLGQWPLLISVFARDPFGELYASDYGGGGIHRLTASPPATH